MITIDYSGKSVFVAGGTSGINRGIAEGFASAGARVAVLSRSQAKVDATVAALEALGADALGCCSDVRDYPGVEQALASAAAAFGPIDVLVSGAAGNFPARALDMSPNGFRAVMEIDLLGTFHVLRAAHTFLRRPGASVINISAPQSFVPMVTQVHVCAAKAGVDMITRTLAQEWGADGIRVNSIVPGPIDGTEGVERLMPTAALRQKVRAAVPLDRLGTTEDISMAALFLGSPLASYISGTVLPVDGGWSLGGVSSLMAEFEAYSDLVEGSP